MSDENKEHAGHKRDFHLRLIRNFVFGSIVMLISLGVGMVGYHSFESLSWIDSYVNAAMILSGMGPVQELKTEGGKIFAGTYALFSGIIFLFFMAIIFSPLFHKFYQEFQPNDHQN